MTKIISTLLVAAALFAAACSNAASNLPVNREKNMSADFQNKLAAEIKRRADQRDASPLNIKALTDGDWDKFYVFPPYTPNSTINQTLGAAASELKSVDMETREEINLLVFTKNGQLKSFVEFPRRAGDFDKVDRLDGFTPETAKFTVSVEDRGEPWITVTEAK